MEQIGTNSITSMLLFLIFLTLTTGQTSAFINPNTFVKVHNNVEWKNELSQQKSFARVLRHRTIFNRQSATQHEGENESEIECYQPSASISRRSTLKGIAATVAATACAPLPSLAAKSEIDVSGELYSPKKEMLSGGSRAGRGIAIADRQRQRLKPGEAPQTVYSARFISYLTRFLLVYDQSAHAWWLKEGFSDSWDQFDFGPVDDKKTQARFAEFAESVEVGLADYFVGPYGSYSSVAAAKAGINAAAPVKSSQPLDSPANFWENILPQSKSETRKSGKSIKSLQRDGVLNLYALLQARYTSTTAKQQLAILFSMISDPDLQPTKEIRSLLGEADNASLEKLEFSRPEDEANNEVSSRTSGRRGGGYSLQSPPEVTIEPPPALGDKFQPAEVKAVMQPSSRVLRIKVTDGGEGYTNLPPQVTIIQKGFRRQCEACVILDREGHVESVVVIDPGYGYGGKDGATPPTVMIEKPKVARNKDKTARKATTRAATAVAELEYEIADIELVKGGNGYALNEPPKITVGPPDSDTDWYVNRQEIYGKRSDTKINKFVEAKIVEMKSPLAKIDGAPAELDDLLLERIKRDPLELIPSSVRPILKEDTPGSFIYWNPSIPEVPLNVKLPSAQYRAFDPVFGGIGTLPVTKSASELKVDEYTRLALSGAVCTVIVRTALNPLELIKTKMQLQNDEELINYATAKLKEKMATNLESNNQGLSTVDQSHRSQTSVPIESKAISQETGTITEAATTTATITLSPEEDKEPIDVETEQNEVSLGTMDVISSLIELRGPMALFQSADVTFLASLVFGSFGFGATELFRRSFSARFFSESTGGNSEFVLLGAAALACIVTSYVASPFETLRVRSMATLAPQSWTDVLDDFLEEKRKARKKEKGKIAASDDTKSREPDNKDLTTDDLAPLFSGFVPIASRELPFGVTKFLAFDLIATTIISFINSNAPNGALPVQVGVGTTGLLVSAGAGAVAGIAGAIVSHPADLILTLTSASKKNPPAGSDVLEEEEEDSDWREIVKDLLSKDGGIANLFVGLPPRLTFFFLVIGLQFFLYDYVKNLFEVSSDDLSLVLDVFYAVRQGLVGT